MEHCEPAFNSTTSLRGFHIGIMVVLLLLVFTSWTWLRVIVGILAIVGLVYHGYKLYNNC